MLDLELYRKELTLSINPDVRISAIDYAPEKPRRTLVLLHGFGGSAIQWQYQIAHFGNENRVIALDLRGHGQSSKPFTPYTMSELVGDIHTALEKLSVKEKIVLAGHSFGGAIAAEYADAYPEQIERLVLIAAAGTYRLNPLYRLAMTLPARVLRWLTPLAKARLGAPPYVLKAMYTNTVSIWQGWELFKRLEVPTLFIRGHHDRVLERPAYDEVAHSIRGAEEVDVGASAHMVMLERRDAVNRAIDRFLTAPTRSWREIDDQQQTSQRAALVRERPWLTQYSDGVPYTIAVPRVPLQQFLESSAKRFPNHVAIKFEGLSLTYRQLDLQSNRFAQALLFLGLEKGDRVMLLLPNLPQTVIAFFGVLKAGGVVVFPSPGAPASEQTRLALDSGARFLVALVSQREMAREILEHARQALPSSDLPSEAGIAPGYHIIFTSPYDFLPPLKRLVVLLQQARRDEEEPASWLALEEHLFKDLLANSSDRSLAEKTTPDNLALIAYTGGTTAESKGVMLSHYNLVVNALQTRAWMVDGRDGYEKFLSVLPFAHSYGLMTALIIPVAMGATMILKPRFETADILKTIQREKPSIFPGVPRMYVAINDFPKVRNYGIQSIRICISGSSPLPVEVKETFEKLTRGRLVEGYGLTEATTVTHANPLQGTNKIGSMGVPLPSTEAKVVDLVRGKKVVPDGQIGELMVRGPQIMMGYWFNTEATQQVLRPDGWLLTGDVAQVDDEGFFRIIARKADMWYPQKSDKPAFPRDIEEILYEIPQVKEAAVVAIAGQPVAFIVARKERPSSEAVIAYTSRRLSPELAPRMVIFLDEFPRSFIGKILRRELARRVEQQKHDSSKS